MILNPQSLWRYVLLKEVDRIFDRSLTPTLIYFVEKVFPESYTKENILNDLKDCKIKWKETIDNVEFYFNLVVYRIDISKRHKNTWKINVLHLVKKEKSGINFLISPTSPCIYANEAVAHAFGKTYFKDSKDLYPFAGIITDLFINIELRKLLKKEEKIIQHTFRESEGIIEDKKVKEIDLPIKSYQGNDPYIFISYSHKDKKLIYSQIKWLNDKGFNIWFDEGIMPMRSWEKVIPEKIFDSSIFIVFISKNSVTSDNVKREISYAIRHKTGHILPIYIEDTELSKDLDFNLKPIQGIMKYQFSDENYKLKVIDTLKKKIY
ncbi:MAG: toll/interleukin-1 receptor domain-containing protein [Candidatus Lokiarchaeota archaeon]|nr:toll/interleukin-1 receptor domain-containing protein [Candidatus Lokiarchaeota archaeon]